MAEVILNRPNFLGSAKNLILKTISIPVDFATYVTENGRKIVKAGTYISTPLKGILFEDADITDGAVIKPLMFAGYYIDANLPTSISSVASTLAGQGLFAFVEGATTRPNFGMATPMAINYINSTYLYPFSGTNYEIKADGYEFSLIPSVISGVDYQINVSGEIPLIEAETKTGLGFDEAVTNIFVALIEIQANSFDITKLKYCRHGGTLASVTTDDILVKNGKTYLINCFGVYDTDSAGTIGNKVASAANMNLIDIQYNGVTKVYKYTYTFGTLEK